MNKKEINQGVMLMKPFYHILILLWILTSGMAQAQVIIVNTCAFLTSATDESIGRLLELSDFKSAETG